MRKKPRSRSTRWRGEKATGGGDDRRRRARDQRASGGRKRGGVSSGDSNIQGLGARFAYRPARLGNLLYLRPSAPRGNESAGSTERGGHPPYTVKGCAKLVEL